VEGTRPTLSPATRERQSEGDCEGWRGLRDGDFTAERAENAELRSRRGQTPVPRSAPAVVGISLLQARSNPRPALCAGRGGDFTASGAVKSPTRAPRQPRWGYHRERAEYAELCSRRGQIPGPRSAPAPVGISPRARSTRSCAPSAVKSPARAREHPTLASYCHRTRNPSILRRSPAQPSPKKVNPLLFEHSPVTARRVRTTFTMLSFSPLSALSAVIRIYLRFSPQSPVLRRQ
jgi:hypothetical protein